MASVLPPVLKVLKGRPGGPGAVGSRDDHLTEAVRGHVARGEDPGPGRFNDVTGEHGSPGVEFHKPLKGSVAGLVPTYRKTPSVSRCSTPRRGFEVDARDSLLVAGYGFQR
ncbi:MAG: hypothetical protein MZU95_05730 [Desulfomicrobium escambiense]|nr:hypothetical protein [Desulfomicrobium escambiense]